MRARVFHELSAQNFRANRKYRCDGNLVTLPTRLKLKQTTWWRHQMETFSALLAICAGNSPVCGEFPAQRPVTWRSDVFFDLRLNKRLSKLSWGWWFETPSRPLWRHCNELASNNKTFKFEHSRKTCFALIRICFSYEQQRRESLEWRHNERDGVSN